MSIRGDSKKIIRFFLSKVIECGDLDEYIDFNYESLANTLGLESAKHCRVCVQYLKGKHCISTKKCTNEANPESTDMKICLCSSAIDFLED